MLITTINIIYEGQEQEGHQLGHQQQYFHVDYAQGQEQEGQLQQQQSQYYEDHAQLEDQQQEYPEQHQQLEGQQQEYPEPQQQHQYFLSGIKNFNSRNFRLYENIWY